MADREVLADAIAALEESATAERSMRIGHDVARVLHAALLDVASTPHQHQWQPLGFDRPGSGTARVIQACVCGEAREVTV